MGDKRLTILSTIADLYLKNPFFILDSSGAKDPLLHQTETVARCIFLKPTRVLIADVIGLGKTITALRIMEMLRIYDDASKVLIITPSMLLPQWVEELKYFGIIPTIIDKEKLNELSKYTLLPSGVYIGSMDRLKKTDEKYNYFGLISKEKWDLIIVDEAHKLGFVGGKPNKRWEILGNLIARSRTSNVVLLTATPHKGYDYDYLARLYIVDPSLLSLGSTKTLKRISRALDSSFYVKTHNVIVHRRTKSDINEIYEGREVFKKCYILAVLVKPQNYEKEMFTNLISVGEKSLRKYYNELALRGYIDPAKVEGVVRLLRKLIVKRGLSSPRALVNTFGKMVKKRREILSRLEEDVELDEVKKIVEEKIPEFEKKLDRLLDPEAELEDEEEVEEYDKVYNEIADSVGVLLPKRFVDDVERSIFIAKEMVDGKLVDSKLETLKRLIEETFREHEGRFKDLKGAKVVVFTEFKDTAEYVYRRLREWLREKFGDKGDRMIRMITSENKNDYERIAKWFREKPYAKVLITTDVLGEGLNLQVANVLVNYEVAYSPVRLEQRIGRIWRYGQRKECYVFNLFYAHKYEKDIARSVFCKLYGINEAVGKQELSLGDEIYISAIGDSLIEKTVRERLGEEYVEYTRYLGGLIPLAVKHRGREIRLTESKIIDALFEGEIDDLVDEFIRTLLDLARKIREKKIYPEPLSRKNIEMFLKQSFGIGNIDEASYVANKIAEIYSNIAGDGVSSVGSTRYDIVLKIIRDRCNVYGQESNVTYFVLPAEKKKVYVLAVAEIKICNEVFKSTRTYREPIIVELDVENKSLKIHRGREFVDMLARILPYAVQVDEVYGVDRMMESEWNRALDNVIGKILNNYSTISVYYNDMIRRINEYESIKTRFGASYFFRCRVNKENNIVVKPMAFFVSVGVFPSSKVGSEDNVWFGFEEQYLRDIVLKYERKNGRKPNIRKHAEEHYDVYSYDDEEERYIEVKGFVKPRLEIRLTEKEYEKAKELGDKYWLYLVYGVGTETPVMLCIRNPVSRIELAEIEMTIVKREYRWSKKLVL